MGVQGLWQLLAAAGQPVTLESLEGKSLAIDVSIWLHQAARGKSTDGRAAHLSLLFRRVAKLLFFRTRPVFVFDGADVPHLKKHTLVARRMRRDVAAIKLNAKQRRRLLDALSKGETSGEVVAATFSRAPSGEADMFELPAESAANAGGSVSSASWSDSDSDDFRDYQVADNFLDSSIESIDESQFTNDSFLQLPAEVRRNVLLEAQERQRDLRLKPESLPAAAADFSQFQLGRLLSRSRMNERVDQINRELTVGAVSLAAEPEPIADETPLVPGSTLECLDDSAGCQHILLRNLNSLWDEPPERSSTVSDAKATPPHDDSLEVHSDTDLAELEAGDSDVLETPMTPKPRAGGSRNPDDQLAEQSDRVDNEPISPNDSRPASADPMGVASVPALEIDSAASKWLTTSSPIRSRGPSQFEILEMQEPSGAEKSANDLQRRSESDGSSGMEDVPVNERQFSHVRDEWRTLPSTAAVVATPSADANVHVAPDEPALSEQIYGECQELLRLFGVPFVVAAGEAEAQCARLETLGLVAATVSDDSDAWLFGAGRLYRHLFNRHRHLQLFTAARIQQTLGLSREDLICVAMLAGGDYTAGVDGVGVVTAAEILSEFRQPAGSPFDALTAFARWHADDSGDGAATPVRRRLRRMRLSVPAAFPDGAVADAYLRPRVDESTERFVWGSPDVDALRRFAHERIGWSEERVDELLAPMVKQLAQSRHQTHITSFTVQLTAEVDAPPSKRLRGAIQRLKHGADTATDPALVPAELATAALQGETVAPNSKAKPTAKRRGKPVPPTRGLRGGISVPRQPSQRKSKAVAQTKLRHVDLSESSSSDDA